MLSLLFFILLLIVLYIYLGYPLILFLKKANATTSSNAIIARDLLPSVSLLIPAHNEAGHIYDKITNALEQDYPPDKLEIIVASDASTDQTAAIARSFNSRRVKVIESSRRGGKNAVLNQAYQEAQGDILVFTDANALFNQEAVRELVKHFADETVGLVCGRLIYTKGKGNAVGRGEGLYFRYESLLKKLESRWGTVPVVTGSIYALRKSLFCELDNDTANDFLHPVYVGARGFKIRFEPAAVAYETPTASGREEFRRRSRIVTRGFTAFARYRKQHRILSGMRGFCFFSHKLLRWFVPFFLAGLFLTNLFLLDQLVFKLTMAAQLAFYACALAGACMRGKAGRVFTVPFYFTMINLAALVGFLNFVRGKRESIWEVAGTTR